MHEEGWRTPDGIKCKLFTYSRWTECIKVLYRTPLGSVEALYYPSEMNIYVERAYAMTVHKAQGGGAKHVIFLAADVEFSRDLFYNCRHQSEREPCACRPHGFMGQACGDPR